MKFSDCRGFRNEFTKLDAPQSTTGCSYANRPYNNMKNRFANVPVYDKTRVILKEEGAQVGSDYINANYISGYQGPKSYIATQAPLPETVIDFWRMIWELEISNIVMVSHCFNFVFFLTLKSFVLIHEGAVSKTKRGTH